jgi:hypothetical protein
MSDDNPYRNPDGDHRPPRRVDGAGVALGVVIGIVLTVLALSLGSTGVLLPVLVGLIGSLLAIWLVTQPSPIAKGTGVGMLVAISVSLLLVGSCLAIIAGIG